MKLRTAFLSLAVCVAASSMAAPPTFVGTLSLNLVAYTNSDGTFEWQNTVDNSTLYTYCMSTQNYIGGNPQVYAVWALAGTTPGDIDASGILLGNSMPGLNSTNFLEAAAQAESYGPNYGITALDDSHNFDVHNTESFGDPSWLGHDYSNAYYLQPINPNGGGQPQLLITPEPGSLAAITALISFVGMRRKKRAS